MPTPKKLDQIVADLNVHVTMGRDARKIHFGNFQEMKNFKAKLSTAEEAALDIPEIDVDVRLTRGEFEVLIGDLLIAFEAALDATLERDGLKAEDIQIVLRTGGSSLIPAVRNILDGRFPERVVEHDPFTSVAAGVAIANYQA